MMQIIRLDACRYERTHQCFQRGHVIIDGLQQNALAEEGNARIEQPGAGTPRRVRKLARVIHMHGDIGCYLRFDGADQFLRDAFRIGDGHARMPAKHFDVSNSGEALRNVREAPWR